MAAALAAGLSGKADQVHGHGIGDVEGLQEALDGKAPVGHGHPGVYAPAVHHHDERYVNEGQASSVTTEMVVDRTLQPEDLGNWGCAPGQVVKWDPTVGWDCGDDLDTDTTYMAGAGLRLESGVFVVDEAVIRGWCYDAPGELHALLDARYSALAHAHDARYYTKEEVDARFGGYYTAGQVDLLLSGKAAAVHAHGIGEVTGLQATLDGKANLGHAHGIGDVAGLQLALDQKAALGHTHPTSEVVGLQAACEGWARGVCYDTPLELAAAVPTWDQNASDDLTTSSPFGGDVVGTYANLEITANAVGSLEIVDQSVRNADIATNTVFLSVQNVCGQEQFAITNGALGLRFAGAGATTVSFDQQTRQVTISSSNTGSGGTVTSVGLACRPSSP